jgi:phosphotransferase system enzyme I (PtsP)
MKNKRDDEHIRLLCSVSEVLALLAGSNDTESFLDRTVHLVASHLHAAVCSIYLFDEVRGELVLRATVGLNPECVGQVTLRLGEGLVGTALKELRSICVARASQTPNFKPVPGSGEERFESFLAVPILRGIEKIGVLVVQRAEQQDFAPAEMAALRAIAAQLAGAIASARALLAAAVPRTDAVRAALPDLVRGRAVCGGFAMGPAHVFGRRMNLQLEEDEAARIPGGESELEQAIRATVAEIEHLQVELGQRLPEAAALIFDAHLMMLKDRGFAGRMLLAARGGMPVGRAVLDVAGSYIRRFEASAQEYIREKARDVEDLAGRILLHLRGGTSMSGDSTAGRIVIARDLLPSELLALAVEKVAGVVLAGGGATSHVAILARSLKLPMVMLSGCDLLSLPDDTLLLVDAEIGNVFIAPAEHVVRRFTEREKTRRTATQRGGAMRAHSLTRDGTRIALMANINLLGELDLALQLKAEGVGLYRTEFPFLVRKSLPSEEEQEAVYRILFQKMQGKEITVRTLDAGGDKMLGYFNEGGEPNPELGLRSTRFTLSHPDIFDQQLRAILRAAAGTRPRIMFPMIASLDEFRQAKGRLLGCLEQVRQTEGLKVETPQVGMMLEVPAVMETLSELKRESDFFSIGTNDFVQYMLAADRTNDRVSAYYCPHHPSVLRGLKRMVEPLRRDNRDVCVCGEMAHDVRYIPFLIGIGVRKLSIEPSLMPEVQDLVSRVHVEEAEQYAAELLAAGTVQDVERKLRRF